MALDGGMIEVRNLTKRFGRTTAVNDVSFRVQRGEIVGFLGPNGAGKTTTMRVLATFLPATAGWASIGGHDVREDALEVRRRIGYLPETVPLYGELRVSEYLRYRGRLKGLGGRSLRERMDAVTDLCGLGDVRRSIIGTLSKGYCQRVGLADALIREPEVLMLDEPTLGLDPNQIRHIRHLIKGLGGRHTVLLSSHILSEVQMICERVLIMNAGRIVAADRTENLTALANGAATVSLEVQGASEAVRAALQGVPGVLRVAAQESQGWCRAICECEPARDLRADLFEVVVSNGWRLRELKAERRNLEEVFVEITRESAGGSAGAGAAPAGAAEEARP